MKKIILILILINFVCFCVGENNMVFNVNSGRFEKMLIFINDNVPEGDSSMLENIKAYMKKASNYLYEATRAINNGAKSPVQFGKIYIKVPRSWNVAGNQLTWQQCTKADLFVSLKKDNNNNINPFTKQLGGCGEPGEFTRFSNTFFTEPNGIDADEAGKIIMNEFVKLRYGVFSEKPYRNMLTNFNGFKFVKSTCGRNINWTINQPTAVCSDRNDVCKYNITTGQTHNYSVMFDTTTPSSRYFCDDVYHFHNTLSQTLQNLKCQARSVGNIIIRHRDFAANNRPLQQYVEPEFEIVKGQNRKIVLVLDTSGSMASIIDVLRNVAASFVNDIVEDTAQVALVQFKTSAEILNYLTSMDSISNRKSVIRNIQNLNSNGGTNIPEGLIKGVQVLGGNIGDSSPVMGTIILLSDGENGGPQNHYDYVIQQIIKKGIVVNAISYGKAGDPNMNKLTDGSKGKFMFAESNNYMNLMKGFAERHSCELVINQTKQVMEDDLTINATSQLVETNLTYIDQYVGVNIKLDIRFPQSVKSYTITLLDPSQTEYFPNQSTNQGNHFILTFQIIGKHKVGMYKLRIKKNNKRVKRGVLDAMKISFFMSSQSSKGRTISPSGELNVSEIDNLAFNDVVRATVDMTTCEISNDENVTVVMTMKNPINEIVSFNMKDDGLNDDSIENDKIFTKIVKKADLKYVGFYNFKADIKIIKKGEEPIYRTLELGSLRVKGGRSKRQVLPNSFFSNWIKRLDN